MPTFTLTPVTVDGVSLDSYAWGVESKLRAVPAVRSGDQAMVGIDGVNPSLNDDYMEGRYVLDMWVRGVDDTGAVPGGQTALSQYRANLEALLFLFSKRHALLDVREDIPVLGTRQILCKVEDVIEPKPIGGSAGRFTVEFTVPSVFGQDVSTSDWTQTSAVSGTVYEVTTLQGASAPIADSVITVTGPALNPQLTDFTTNAYVRLNANLPAGQVWRINVGTWATRYGTGLTFSSADTAGATSGDGVTVYGGRGTRFLTLQPELNTGLRRVRVALSGSSFTSATAIGVRARRKFLN